MLAERIRNIPMSPTLRISALAGKMSLEGIDVLDFSVGEPDFPTPTCVKEAGKEAIDRNLTLEDFVKDYAKQGDCDETRSSRRRSG